MLVCVAGTGEFWKGLNNRHTIYYYLKNRKSYEEKDY